MKALSAALLLALLWYPHMTVAQTSCFPRGISDLPHHTAYVAREDGLLAAIDLRDGRQEWTSADASAPLLVTSGRLAAIDLQPKSQRFTVAFLDPASGKVLARSEPVPLGGIAEPPLNFQAGVEGSLIHIRWHISGKYRGGAAPPLQQANAPPLDSLHSLLADPATGRVTQVAASPKPATPIEPPSPASVRYLRDAQWAQGPWAAGGRSADLVESGPDNHSRLSLRLSDKAGAGRAGAVRKVTDLGPLQSASIPLVTKDGMYVLVAAAGNAPENWTVFNAATGAQVGRAGMESAARDICVLDSRLYYVTAGAGRTSSELTLSALDLATNRKLWDYPLGQLRTSAPPPLPR